MTRIRCSLGILALALCCILAEAENKAFWAAKPFTEWTEKEVEFLLKHSPWCKVITINLGTPGGSQGGFGRRGGGGSRGGGMGGGGMGGEGIPSVGVGGGIGGGGTGGLGGGRGASEDASPSRTAQMLVVWYSQPVRQAMARSMTLRNPNPPQAELDKLLNYPESPYYDLMVIGWRWDPRTDKEEVIRKLKEETFLEKKGNVRIPLANAILPSGLQTALVLLFPKQAGGSPTLSPVEKEVTLQFKYGRNTFRTKFKLQEMTINDAPAL